MRPRKIIAPVTLFAKVPSKEYQAVREIAFGERRSIADVTRQAIAEFVANHKAGTSREKKPSILSPSDRRRFDAEATAAFQRLRDDPKAWQEELEERKLWEATLPDGLGADDVPEKARTPRRTRRTRHD